MSANGENQKNEHADTGRKWVWWSTEESFERGAISVLACAEVAAGIGLYWWRSPPHDPLRAHEAIELAAYAIREQS